MNPKRLNSDKAEALVQSNEYDQGLDQAGNKEESVEGIRDLTGQPYGKKGMGLAENTGKLGSLDPQETDQPSWVNTWAPHNTGPNGAGVTNDENYGAARPRTQTRQEDRFKFFNPEFQDVANVGDWTSLKWDPKV